MTTLTPYAIGLLDFWCAKLAAWIRGGDAGKIKRFRPINRKAFLLALNNVDRLK
jgi:hypothetical protein